MFDEKEYKAVFSKVTASGETHRRILNMTNQNQKYHSTRMFTRVLVAAVMSSLLAVTVAASEFGWFVGYFSKETQSALNEEQIDFIQERERNAQQSQTHDGYTVTLESYFADSMFAWFKLKIQCPEGVQFCDSPWGTSLKGVGLIRKSDGEDLGGGGVSKLPDEDTTDNIGYLLFIHEEQGIFATQSLLEDPYYTLQIRGLHDIYLANDDIVFDTVAEGIWEFDIDFRGMEDSKVELIGKPLDYLMISDDNLEIPVEVPIRITSFSLYPMRAAMQFEYLEEETYGYPDDFAPCTVVMKDGTKQVLNTFAVMCGSTEFRSPVPLILSEVDHILLADGTKLPMPE